MKDTYKCAKCGAITTDPSHLCAPEPVSAKSRYCGTKGGHLCEPAREKMSYQCEKCGRPAEEPGLVCKPAKMSV